MLIETNIGYFGTWKDLEICMRLENHKNVIIYNATWWGTNLLLNRPLELTYDEVLRMSRNQINLSEIARR